MKNSLLENMKTSHNPIYFNYHGASSKLGARDDPMKQANILYSLNGSSSDEGSYDKESGKFVAKQGKDRLRNTILRLRNPMYPKLIILIYQSWLGDGIFKGFPIPNTDPGDSESGFLIPGIWDFF